MTEDSSRAAAIGWLSRRVAGSDPLPPPPVGGTGRGRKALGRGGAGLAVGAALLVVQGALVIHGLFVESRDFNWAPHTTQVRFTIDVRLGGRTLPPDAVSTRYGLVHNAQWEAHSYQNLINLVRQRERTYGKEDGARVTLRYSVNGARTQTWSWPER